jgi:hypothetical protein
MLNARSLPFARLTTANLPHYLADLFDHFEAAFARADRQVKGSLGDCLFICRTDTAAYSGIVRRGLATTVRSATGKVCRILAGTAARFGLPPSPVWGERFYREREVEAALKSTRYRLHHLFDFNFWQFYDRETGRGIQLCDRTLGLPPWDRGSPLRNFLQWHLTESNCNLIHAGSLGVEGVGILLAGPGGSGKSGTVLAGVAHGLDTVGDDYILARTGETIVAQPLFNTLKQDPAGLVRLGLMELQRTALNWQGKHQFDIADVGSRKQAEQIVIRALCVPQISGEQQTRFLPLPTKDAFLALAPSGVSQIPGERGEMFTFAAKLVRQLPTYRLALGTDPAEIAQAVRTFIQEGPR